MMNKDSKIYIAGHTGLVGSAILRLLMTAGFTNLVYCSHAQLDLTNQISVNKFFEKEKPDYVFLAAAKVGGILANNTYRADFYYQNIMIQSNIIHASYLNDVKRLLFLGSSCIYPKEAPQPIQESALLTGPLEITNRPYALAKIAGIEQCWAYNCQYGTQFIAAMPCNSYGPNDNFHPENSHVIPGLIRRICEAKTTQASSVTVWGSGRPRRELIHADDLANACIYLMNLPQNSYMSLINDYEPPLINIGTGIDYSILEIARMICDVANWKGDIQLDLSKLDGTYQKLLDCSKLFNLGWKPTINLIEGLKQTYTAFEEKNL